jgi:membrane protease YdiL (CAAX protease family)
MTQATPTERSATSARSQGDYWELTRQPLPSLLFLLPLLFVYEWGAWWAAREQALSVRNGADQWMREGLLRTGVQFTHVLPLLVIVGLLAWHYGGRYRSRLSPDLMAGMYGESILFAVLLLVLGQAQDLLFQRVGEALSLVISSESICLTISYLGAGIYEEVLFRGILCSGLFGLGCLFHLPKGINFVQAAILSSLLFSTAHYIGPSADVYTHFSFVFRFFAGLYFAGLFLIRGLGIAIGTHAIYDLIVGLMLPSIH